MAKSAIEKFISNYLRNKKISESEEGYEAWLRKNGVDPTAELSDRIGKSYAESEKASSDYSSVKEALAENGLTNSGYAKYLGERALARRDDGIESAIQSYLGSDAANKKEYSNELERQEAIRLEEKMKAEEERLKAEEKAKEEAKKAEEKALEEAKKAAEKAAAEAAKKEEESLKREEKIRDQLLKEAESQIKSMSTIDYEKAYKYAIEIGLDRTSAEKIAKTITEERRSSAIEKVSNAIVSKRLTMNQTKEYALSLGLSEEDATNLGELAFRANESVGDIVSQDDYLDYLRELVEKNK